jgi:AcrR family transcriptional regulator
MAKKAPRRTAQRILEAALDLFNRFGEPNVSTTLVAGELNISPGNLYYHYPAKEELINRLYEGYEAELNELLHASEGVHDVEDAWFFMHTLFELIWRYRFLYRDLNDLLSKNRHLETQFQLVLKNKARAIRQLIAGLGRAGHLDIDAHEVDTAGPEHGGGADLLAELRVRAQPARGARARACAGRADARRPPHPAPARALPRARATAASADTEQCLQRRRCRPRTTWQPTPRVDMAA